MPSRWPPFGAALFREVQRRLAPRRTAAITLRAPEAEGLPALSHALAALLTELGARQLVAHGLAVPVALGLPDDSLDALILTNGPITRVDPVARALSRPWPRRSSPKAYQAPARCTTPWVSPRSTSSPRRSTPSP